MHRLQLLNHKGLLLTPDTAQALNLLQEKASANKWRLVLSGPTAGVQGDNLVSLIPAGREVHLKFIGAEGGDTQAALNALWGHAIPLGFTPWLRYPILGSGDAIFHFLGPWVALYDRLLSEGRGHLAWPSVCAAAQCDVGVWKGSKADERFVQAQLHRVGRNCGPVDGEIGPRTAEAVETLGLKRAAFADVMGYLKTAEPPTVTPEVRKVGHIAVPGRRLNVAAYGSIKAVKTLQGATLTIDGPGRVIVDVGGVT